MLIKTKNGMFKCDNAKIDNKMMKAIKSFNGDKAILKTENGDFTIERVNNAGLFDSEIRKSKEAHRKLLEKAKKAKDEKELDDLRQYYSEDFGELTDNIDKIIANLNYEARNAMRTIISERDILEKEIRSEYKRFK